MVRRRLVVLLAALLVPLVACGLPARKDPEPPAKVAASRSEAATIFDRYVDVRATAYELLDPGPLSTIEAGSVLQIDSGAISVHRLLGEQAPNDAVSSSDVTVLDVYSPRFGTYPLWFLAVVRDDDRGLTRVQVYERPAAAMQWALVASPETTSEEALPELGFDSHGALETLPPGDTSGLVASPTAVAATYATALEKPGSPEAGQIGTDGFVEEVRRVNGDLAGIKGITYDQTWTPQRVKYVVRTADGGALVFATLTRKEKYRIKDGAFVDWPDGSPQKAFLGGKLYARGELRYFHQVLLYVPKAGDGKPHAIGQYGGIVDGDGY
ncbi:hypothetical protein [Solicola gregarius]|uniref:DUF8094 domain-containing protein n=1 Tax=Solicola gregarius TaxID=2908642 RepID=A0AA46TID5_9ACTN|nr:hypothetical protein [Solicola gregarius]UYM05904.1 hypothetical protein L0C25_02190 [Solicola gregarius]